MADKKITDLQLRDNVDETLNFSTDDGIQSYRVTAQQIKNFILSAGAVIRSMIAETERIPIASVIPFAGTTAPAGYLMCEGQQVSRTEYASLFAIIGTSHGQGDGSTTFHLPDYRGRVLRGTSGSSTLDPDRASRTAMNTGGNTGNAVGSVQNDAFQGHRHRHVVGQSGTSANSNSTTNAYASGVTAAAAYVIRQSVPFGYNEVEGDAAITLANGSPRVSDETRMKNAYANFIIKF